MTEIKKKKQGNIIEFKLDSRQPWENTMEYTGAWLRILQDTAYPFGALNLQASKWRIWWNYLKKCIGLETWTSKPPCDEFDKEFSKNMYRFGALDLQASKWRIWLRLPKDNVSIWSLGPPNLQVTNLIDDCLRKCVDLEPWTLMPPNDEFDSGFLKELYRFGALNLQI